VTQLSHDLVNLGYADSADISALGWDYFTWQTKSGLEQLQCARGITSPPGSLPLGSVVFEPSALRAASVTGSLGNSSAGPVLSATSTRHVVTVSLNASQQSQVKAGDTVSVTLPDGASTPGVISSVGKVAHGRAARRRSRCTSGWRTRARAVPVRHEHSAAPDGHPGRALQRRRPGHRGQMTDRELPTLRAARIGFVFQQFFLAEHQKVIDNVADGLLYAGIRRDQRRRLASTALARVGRGNRWWWPAPGAAGGRPGAVQAQRRVAGSPFHGVPTARTPRACYAGLPAEQVLGQFRFGPPGSGAAGVLIWAVPR
jgi:hypothetical protein